MLKIKIILYYLKIWKKLNDGVKRYKILKFGEKKSFARKNILKRFWYNLNILYKIKGFIYMYIYVLKMEIYDYNKIMI